MERVFNCIELLFNNARQIGTLHPRKTSRNARAGAAPGAPLLPTHWALSMPEPLPVGDALTHARQRGYGPLRALGPIMSVPLCGRYARKSMMTTHLRAPMGRNGVRGLRACAPVRHTSATPGPGPRAGRSRPGPSSLTHMAGAGATRSGESARGGGRSGGTHPAYVPSAGESHV